MRYKTWIAALGTAIMSIQIDSKLVGHSCILPLTKSAYLNYRRGLIRDIDFGPSELDANHFSSRPAKYICLQAIMLQQPLTRAHWELFKIAFSFHLTSFNRQPDIARPKLIAEGATAQGVHLLEKWGFLHVGTAVEGASIYELDLANDTIAPRGARTLAHLVQVANVQERSGW